MGYGFRREKEKRAVGLLISTSSGFVHAQLTRDMHLKVPVVQKKNRAEKTEEYGKTPFQVQRCFKNPETPSLQLCI